MNLIATHFAHTLCSHFVHTLLRRMFVAIFKYKIFDWHNSGIGFGYIIHKLWSDRVIQQTRFLGCGEGQWRAWHFKAEVHTGYKQHSEGRQASSTCPPVSVCCHQISETNST